MTEPRLRVGALAPYPESGPSTRFRLAQFRAALAERGIDLEILPFVAEAEYSRLFARGAVLSKAALLGRGLLERRRHLKRPDIDLWVVHRELSPLGPLGFLRSIRRSGVPYVFDFDDAIFLDPVGGHPLLAPLRKPRQHTAELCRHAGAVLAGNPHLADFADEARHQGDGVTMLPTVIDTDRFRPARAPGDGSVPPRVGWIGTHTTSRYVEPILPALEEVHRRRPFRFRVVSNRAPDWVERTELDVEFERWTPDGEVSLTQDLDVGLYPLPDTQWTRGKCGFKAIQYLACAVPVVASPVGVLERVVPDGVAGRLASTPEDWQSGLEWLLEDPERRRSVGQAGRGHIEAEYSVAAVVGRMAEVMRETAGR